VNPKDDEDDMREGEYFHALRIPKNMWKVIRLDGRTFHKLTLAYKKPFDLNFRDRMVGTAKALMEEYSGLYAHTHSDEISILLPPEWTMFDNELEKLVSSTAASATAEFNFGVQERSRIGKFDSRIWIAASTDEVVRYFSWRQKDCLRCAINCITYWHMRHKGMNERQATHEMEGKNFSWKNEYLHRDGLNFNSYPRWQKRGIGLYWETYMKDGFNPKKQTVVKVERRRVVQDLLMPTGEEYENYVDCVLELGYPIIIRKPTVLPKPEMLEERSLLV